MSRSPFPAWGWGHSCPGGHGRTAGSEDFISQYFYHFHSKVLSSMTSPHLLNLPSTETKIRAAPLSRELALWNRQHCAVWGSHRCMHFPDTANSEMGHSNDYPHEGMWCQGQVGKSGTEGHARQGGLGQSTLGPMQAGLTYSQQRPSSTAQWCRCQSCVRSG